MRAIIDSQREVSGTRSGLVRFEALDIRKGARNVFDSSCKAGAHEILGVRVAEIPRVVTSAAGRAPRTARFDPRRRWSLPRVAGGKPLLRSSRRDACRGGLSSHQRKDRWLLHL